MTQTSLADTIKNLAAPLAAGLGLEIWGIELAFGGRSLVRVYVEKPFAPPPSDQGDMPEDLFSEQGVSIDECAELSRMLGLSLEVEDAIPDAYVLEVSSPGLDRVFFTEAQLATAAGRQVDVQLERPLAEMPDRRKFRGLLSGAPKEEGGSFTLLADDCPTPGQETEISFVFADIKKVRQLWLPPEKKLPGKGGKGKKGGPKAEPKIIVAEETKEQGEG
jgi:Uncharacterized protein conserved in bacteria